MTVRDDNSFCMLKKYGIEAEKCSDPVWNIYVPEIQKEKIIGVQLRSFTSLSETFLNNIANSINKYYSNKEIHILSLQNRFDMFVSEELRKKLININPNIKVSIFENNSNEKVISHIARMEAIIAMRYHACLIAIKAGVKLLPINYDIKVETLAKEFNLEYINMNEDINYKFERFVSSDIVYDKEKINSFNFDFSCLEKKINQF